MIKRRVLYIGWVGFRNHGDDICLHIFRNRLTAAAQAQGLEVEVLALYPSRFDEFTLARLQPDLVVLGAGSLFELVYLKPLILAQQAGIPTAIWGSGYDSIQEDPVMPHDLAFAVRQVLSRAEAVGVRGPYTLRALANVGVLEGSVAVTGDPGLLWLAGEAESIKGEEGQLPQLAVNWGTAYNNVLGGDEKQTAGQVAEALGEFAGKFRLLFYPMWHKDIEPCHSLAEMVGRNGQVQVLTEVPTPEELREVYAGSLCSINMKLHASVFSAALGCPFISVAYRWKCVDFAQSVGLESFAIPFSEPNLAAKLKEAIEQVTTEHSRHQQHLAQQVSAARKRLYGLEKQILRILTNR